MRKAFHYVALLCLAFSTLDVASQANLAVGGTLTQNFNTVITGGTALPTGWKAATDNVASGERIVQTSYTSAGTTPGGNTISLSSCSGITGGGYSLRNTISSGTGGTDYSVGFVGSGSIKNGNLYLAITNNGASAISSFTISYSVKKYRNGNNAAGFTVQMLTTTSASAVTTGWTALGAAFNTSFATDGNTNCPNNTTPGNGANIPNATNSVVSQVYTLGTPLAPTSTIYFVWNYAVSSGATSTNAPQLGIDDVSITANAGAGSNHTVSFTGSPSDFYTGEKFTAAANNTDYYITFDANYMYFGAFRTSGTFGSSDNFAIYLDTDPRSTPTSGNGTTGGRSYSSVTPTLPFNADYTSYTEQSYTDPINRYNGSWATTGVTPTSSTSTTAREVRIALSDIGNPASVYVSMWMGYSGGIFSNAPGTNVAASGTPTITGFFGSFPVYKSGVNPTSYRTQNTSSANGGGTAISDLVLTSSGNIADDYGDITISNAAVGTVSVANASFSGTLTMSNTSTIALGTNKLNVGGRGIGGSAGLVTMNNTSTTPVDGTSTAGTFNFLGLGLIDGSNSTRTFGTNSTVALSGGVDFTSSATNINGILQINAGGYVNTNPPTYGGASTLIYNGGSTFTAGAEWTANATSGTGVPFNVTIGNGVNTTLSFGTSSQYRDARGSVTIAASSGLTLSSNSGGDIYVGGSFTNNGTFTHSSRAIFFNGTGTQTLAGTLNGSSTTNFFPYMFVTNTTGNVTCGVSINVGTSGQSSFTVAASGGVYIQTAGTFTLVTGALGTVNGIFRNSGGTITNTGTMTVSGTGTYDHNMNAGTIGTCTWSAGSTCLVTGITSLDIAGGLGQSFSDFTWNCAQSGGRSLSGGLTSVGRDFNVISTGSQNLGLVASTGSLSLSIGRDFNISGGLIVATTGSVTPTISVAGNLNISGTGTLNLANSAATGAGTSALTVTGNTSITSSSGTALICSSSSAKSGTLTCNGTFLLNGAGTIHMSQSTNSTPTGTLVANGAITLTAGTMNVASTSANAVGVFNANGGVTINGATLNISTLGTGTVNFTDNLSLSSGTISRTSGTSTMNFSKASGTQTITQSSGTFSGIIAGNAGTGSTTNTVQLSSDLNLGSGTGVFTTRGGTTFDFQTYVVTGSGTFASASSAIFKTAHLYGLTTAGTGATGGSVQTTTRTYVGAGIYVFNGAALQATGNFSTASSPTANSINGLTIDNGSNVTLTSAVTVNGLTLTNGHLVIGNNNILVTSITGASSAKHVKTTGTGSLQQAVGSIFSPVTYPVGNTAYNPITLGNTGTLDNYGVRVIDAVTSPAPNDATKLINRYWAITETTGGGGSLTAAAQYNLGEENANFTAGSNLKMGLHNGTTWTDVAATSSGSGPVIVTNSSAFSPSVTTYTIGVGKDDGFAAPNTSYTWTGATDDSWATTTNWTPNGTPSISDDVLIDPANYTTQLVMTDTRTVTNFTVQNSGTYTMNSGSSLTVTGNFSYTSTTAPTLNCASTLAVAGSTSQTIPAFNYGNLNLSGGARVLANSGTIGICGTYTPGTSTTITGSTINYNATGAQTITAATYNNLTISQNRGAAAISLGTGTIDVAGTFDPSTASNYTVTVGTNAFNFSSASTQTIPAFFYYNITNTGNGNRTWASSGTIDINNAFTPGSGTHTVTGSTIKYSSTSATAYTLTSFTSSASPRHYNNLELVGGASTTWAPAASFNIGCAGDFTLSGAGTMTVATNTTANTMTVDGNVLVSGAGTLRVSNTTTTTIVGTLTVTGNTTVSNGVLNLVGSSSNTTVQGNMTTNDLTISGTGKLLMDAASNTSVGTVTVNGNMVVSGSTAAAVDFGSGTNSANNIVNVKGNFTKSGTATLGFTGTFYASSGYNFNGTGTQQWSHSGAAMTASSFTIASGSTLQLLTDMTLGSNTSASALTVTGTLDAGAFAVNASASQNQFTLSSTGTIKTTSASGIAGVVVGTFSPSSFSAGGTFEFSGTNVNTGFSGFANLLSSNAHTITWTGSGSLTFDKAMSLTNLNFTNSGLIYLGNFNVTIASAGAINGGSFSASKMIVTDGTGVLIRSIASGGAGIPFTWPIGEVTGTAEYSPVTISNISISIPGTIGFTVADGIHPSMGAASSYISRYWEYTVTGLGTYNWTNATFTYTSGDIVVGPEASLKANVYNTGTAAWAEFATSGAASNVLTFSSGITQATIASGDEITARIDVPIYYQTVAAGPSNWASVSTWQASASSLFTSPFTPAVPPSATNSVLIRINAGHTVSVTANTTADDLVINGTVDVSGASTTFTVSNGSASTDATIASTGTLVASTNSTVLAFLTGASTSVDGLLKIMGTSAGAGASVSNASGSTINMNNGSTYEHARDGGTLTMGGTVVWNTGSTCRVSGLTLNIPTVASWGQSFSNLTVHSNISSSLNLSGYLTTVNGNFRVTSTGAGALRLAAGQTYSLAVGGKMEIASGATLDVVSGAGAPTITVADSLILAGTLDKSGAGTSTFNLNGDLYQPSGGAFNFTSVSSTTIVNLKGNLTQNGTFFRNNGTATFNFNKVTGTQTWGQTGGTVSGGHVFNVNGTSNIVQMVTDVNLGTSSVTSLTIANGTTLDFQDKVLTGTNAIFNMGATATLKMGSQYGITTAAAGATSGNLQTLIAQRNVNATSTYVYSGTVNQVTGNLLPATLTGTGKLTISNTGTSGNNTVTLTTTGMTTPQLNLTAGLFAIGTSQQLNITSGGTVNASGGDFATGATGGLLNFPGTGTFTGSCSPYNVNINGGVNFGTGTVTIQNAGTLQINVGGFANTNAAAYASGSTLKYNIGATYGRSIEWSTTTGKGHPHHVLVTNNTTLNAANTGASAAAVPMNIGGNLSVDAGASVYMDFGGNNMTEDLVVAGDISLLGNLSQSGTSGSDIFLGGNWTNNGTGVNYFANARAVFFNGAGTQTISGTNTSFPVFAFLRVNKTSGSVVLARDVTFANTLLFQTGNTAIIDAASFTLYASSNSTTAIDRQGAGHVKGNLKRAIATGTNTYDFHIGDASTYAPASLALTSVTVAGDITASTTTPDHVSIASSGLDASKSVNRTWTLTNGSVTLTSYSPTFTFVAGDLDGGANTANLLVGRYAASTWTYPTVGTRTSTTTQATGVTGYGEFALAECKTPTAFTVTGGGTYCAGDPGVAVGISNSEVWVSYQLQRNGSDIGSPVTGTGAALSFGNQTLAGTYTVVATNTSSPSCTASMTGSVAVAITTLTGGISGTTTILCNVSTSISFTGTPSATITYTVNGGSNQTIALDGTGNATLNTGILYITTTYALVSVSDGTCTQVLSGSAVVTVTPVTPSVTISANPGSTICASTSVTFTAVPQFGGITPSYQWKVNGGNAGTNSATFVTTSLVNGDIVTCEMTSNDPCASPALATSNSITMVVIAYVTPSVNIAASPSSTICSSTNVTFTATPTNGGGSPSYQWKLNGSNVGTNSDTYSTSTLVNGDQVSCVMTSNFPCLVTPTATSTAITMTVIAAAQVDAGTNMTTCGTTPYVFSNGASNANTTGIAWTENGAGSITSGSTTLTPTYTPAAGDLGNVVTFTLTGTGNSPCGVATDIVTLTVNPLILYYLDNDGDGFGNPLGGTVAACTPPLGRVADNTDCCDTNADINPLTEWWADVDGDGYGSFIYTNGCISGCSGLAQTIPYYPAVHGGASYSPDCNDNNTAVHPGATEICQNNTDDDCDALIDEGCSGIINDNYSNASTILTTNSNTWYPNCQVHNGTLVNAAVSSEGNPANVAVGGGRDAWYKFTAISTGAQIKVVPTGFDAVVELRTSPYPAAQLDVENVNATVGGVEILNTNALTIGQVYYVGIRNYNPTNAGTFTVCVSSLMPSGCAYTQPVGGYPLCSNFKALYRGAATYTFNFTGTGGAAAFPFVTTSGTTTGLIPMSNTALDLRYNGVYSVRVDANYSLFNGIAGAEPVITVLGNVATANCSGVTISAQPNVEVKSDQRCPASLTRNMYLIASPVSGNGNACSATSYTFKFTQVSDCTGATTVGFPFEVQSQTNTPYLMLSAAFPTPTYPLANVGRWKVQVRPNFSYGAGSYGPVQHIQVNGTTASMMAPDEDGLIGAEKSVEANLATAIYPNPGNGEMLHINLTDVTSDVVYVNITDATGRMVCAKNYAVENNLNTVIVFDQPLSGGLYFVEFRAGETTSVQKFMVER